MIAHIFVAFLEKLNFEGRIEKFEQCGFRNRPYGFDVY